MIQKTILCLLFIFPVYVHSQNIDLLILNKEYSRALKLIDQQLSENRDANLLYKKGLILKKRLLYPEAITQFNEAIKLDSTKVDFWIESADIHQTLGDFDESVYNYQRAIQLEPKNLMHQFELGQTYIRLTDYKNALAVFEKIHRVDSLNLLFNKFYALAAFKSDKYKLAIAQYEKLLQQNPNDLSAYLNLASSYSGLKKTDQGLDVMFKAYERFSNNKSVHQKLANSLYGCRKYGPAEEYYRSYMQKYDTILPVMMNYGICLYQNKKYNEALDALEACYADAPNDPYVNFYLGVSHKKLNNFDLAVKYLDFAIDVSMPDFLPEMYHHLGQVYGSMRRFKESIEALNKAYELDNRKVELLFEIATTYEEFEFNKSLALNYYRNYLLEAGDQAQNASYALDRIKKIKEELFFEGSDNAAEKKSRL